MWQPLHKCEHVDQRLINLDTRTVVREDNEATETVEVWQNDIYEVIARRQEPSGVVWLSIKRFDRGTVIPWRHKQQIKNEICGELCEGMEIYPAESRLADTANEYHLWVLPEGMVLPMGFNDGAVSTDEQARRFSEDPSHKGKQAAWEPGLTTGRNGHAPMITEEQEARVRKVVTGQ